MPVLAQASLSRQLFWLCSRLGMKGNLPNPILLETMTAASLITLPVISSPLQLYRLYTMVTIALPFIFRRWMPVTERNRHTVLATDPICPTIPNYASGTDIRYGSTHLYYKTDVTLQGGRCPADQPSNVTAVGRPHVSTPEAFSKAATPIYIFINNSKIALF